MTVPEATSRSEPTDSALLTAFVADRGEAAFGQLVQRHGGMVLAVCQAVLGQTQDAEDAAQAVFLTLAQKPPTGAARTALAGWLHRVAWYVARRAAAARANRRRHEQEAARMKATVTTADDGQIAAELLHAGLADLPEKYRAALLLHYVEGRSQEETAALLGCGTSAVAMRLHRGRAMLQQRLVKRGLAGAAVGLVAGMAARAAPAMPPALAAATTKAGAAAVAGNIAAGAAVSTHVCVLSKGAMNMLYWAKVKVWTAVIVALLAGLATTYVALAQMGGGLGAGTAAPTPPKAVAPVTPLAFTKVDPATRQTQALAMKLDVSYRRVTPGEFIDDLHRQTRVRILCAEPLREWRLSSLEASGLTVKDVIEKLAAQAKLIPDFQPDAVILTEKADDARLAALAKQFADGGKGGDRWQRANALWQLAALGDPRIYPTLTKALSDPDPGVVEWTLRALERHRLVARLWTNDQKDAIVTAIAKRVADERAQFGGAAPAGGRGGMGGGGMGGGGMGGGGGGAWAPWAPNEPRAQLLGATKTQQALDLLFDWLKPTQPDMLRAAAATGLAAAGTGQEELRALWHETHAAGSVIDHAVYMALLELQDAEALGAAYAAVTKFGATSGPLLEALEETADLKVVAELRLGITRKLDFLYTFTAAPAATGRGNPDYHNAMVAAQTLAAKESATDDDLFTKLLSDTKALTNLAAKLDDSALLHLPAARAALLNALLAHLKDADPQVVRLVIRSLGYSHDPKAADALIQLLDDKDPWNRAEAARALAHTRDPRALDKLLTLLHAKLDWPDVEAEDRQLLLQKKPFTARVNPRTYVLLAILDTRDPKLLDALVALAQDQTLPPDLRNMVPELLPSAVWSAADADHLFDVLAKKFPAALVLRVLFDSARDERSPQGVAIVRMSTGTGPFWPPLSTWQKDDARWVQLLADNVAETRKSVEGAMLLTVGGAPVGGGMNFNYYPAVEALCSMYNPLGEHALFPLAKDEDPDLARTVQARLRMLRDPNLDALLKK